MIARDPLTSALELVRMRTAIFCRGDVRAPWAITMPTKRGVTFHIALDAPFWILRDGAADVRVETGDFVVFPGTTPHTIADAPATKPVRLQSVMPFDVPTLGTRTFSCDGGGAASTILTGVFRFDQRDQRLLAALPGMLHIRAAQTSGNAWLPLILECLASEAGDDGPGKQMILSRLGDIMFIHAVRAALATHAVAPGWFAALRDEQMSAVVGLMHRHPEQQWTVDALASAGAMSRATFARRFRDVVGRPPLEYLTGYRMDNAARCLREGSLTLREIAGRYGYQSEMALAKAFKRSFGVSPTGYRRSVRA